jgi:hypothetical protein
MATRTRTRKRRLSWATLAAAALVGIVFAIAGASPADLVKNNAVANSDAGVGGVWTISPGSNAPIDYWLQATGSDGCDATASSPVTIGINVPTDGSVTADQSSLTFTACDVRQTVNFTSSVAGDHKVPEVTAPSGIGTATTAFTLRVQSGSGGGGGGGSTDSTPPSIAYDLIPSTPDGNNGWYVSNVTLHWIVSEPDSPSSLVTTGCVDQSITTDQAATDYSCSATSDGGSAGPVTVTIKRDATPPTISGSASPPANGYGWNNTDVNVSFSCGDNLSGVASCGPNQTLSNEGAGQSASGTAVDNAGNSSATATVSGINIDKTPPSLNISGAASGAFNICSGVPSRPSFNPTDLLSTVLSYSDSWTTPTTAAGVGTYTYTAQADDKAGNHAQDSRTYDVTYGGAFGGYLQPINSDGSSRFKLGSTIPVKFQLLCGSTPIATAVAKLYVAKGDAVPDPGVDEAISTAASTTGNLFRYDSTAQQYIFNLSTKLGYTNPGSSTATSFSQGTWTLKILLDDNTWRSINVQLVR